MHVHEYMCVRHWHTDQDEEKRHTHQAEHRSHKPRELKICAACRLRRTLSSICCCCAYSMFDFSVDFDVTNSCSVGGKRQRGEKLRICADAIYVRQIVSEKRHSPSYTHTIHIDQSNFSLEKWFFKWMLTDLQKIQDVWPHDSNECVFRSKLIWNVFSYILAFL